jgi:hypothetical protein
MTGSPNDADNHYDKVRKIYHRLPNSSRYLQALEHNRAAVTPSSLGESKPWWKIWLPHNG